MTTLLGSGVYDSHEVSRLLGERVEAVIRWGAPDGRGRPAIVAPTLGSAFSFVDLVSLKVVSDLRARNVPEVDIRQGVAYLEQHTGHVKPLAHREVVELLATSGTALLVDIGGGWYDIGKGGQGAFKEVVRLWLNRVSYDATGVAELWRPAKLVLINPAVQAGAPCVEGTRAPTGTVADMAAEDPLEAVAADLDLTLEQVMAAVAFERSLHEGRGLAA